MPVETTTKPITARQALENVRHAEQRYNWGLMNPMANCGPLLDKLNKARAEYQELVDASAVMSVDARLALDALLVRLTPTQAAALMDVLSSAVENVEVDCIDEDDIPAEHNFISEISDLVSEHVASAAAE